MEYDVKDIALYMWKNGKKLVKKVYGVLKDIDENISFLKLALAGIKIGELMEEQKIYLASREMGT
jgi:S-adenosylhomocysteine hydrolase